MARQLHKLTKRGVDALTKPGRYSDGGGLYAALSLNGGKRWVFLYSFNKKQVELGLGSIRDVSLAKARDAARTHREALASGLDPRTVRPTATPRTFGECADQYIESMRPSWKNAKHANQWSMTLTKYAAPIRSMPISDISTDDVLKVLKPIWQRTPETGERLRGRIENVLDAAKATGHRSGENPARWRGHLDQLLPKRQRLSRGHHAALPYQEIAGFIRTLRGVEALAAIALEFTILTASRTNEVLGAQWDEIDVQQALWIIPPKRMKAGVEHRVPLTSRALDILALTRSMARSRFVFPGTLPQKPLSNMAMAMILRRHKPGITVHGFRSTFRDWASEQTNHSAETCEAALAHTISNKAEAAYRRMTQIEKRRLLMDDWAAYCEQEPAEKLAG